MINRASEWRVMNMVTVPESPSHPPHRIRMRLLRRPPFRGTTTTTNLSLMVAVVDDQKPRKRGRPPKARLSHEDRSSPGRPHPNTLPPSLSRPAPAGLTPRLTAQQPPPPAPPPAQPSPSKLPPAAGAVAITTPTAATKTVIKALPTVRDHTTDQLAPEGDEYIPREYDEAGEKKVTPNGEPLEGREYRCRTFLVPNRGNKLFMLATECARVLGYRDSYLLFNKNRSLFKIIASHEEKEDLIHQGILPYSYRSRQIAIVTAKSMFRQFGSRVINDGRRVRDDYWESKARKQGFTEEDLAGEKRPGAGKVREDAAPAAAAAAAAGAANVNPASVASVGGASGSGLDPSGPGSTSTVLPGPHQDIVYSVTPGHHLDHHAALPHHLSAGGGGSGGGGGLGPLPMIQTDDLRPRDYSHVPRPRQDIAGPPYQDRTHASSAGDILNHAQQAADYNRVLGQQRATRTKNMDDFWTKTRENPLGSYPHEVNAAAAGVSGESMSTGGHAHATPSPPMRATAGYGTDVAPSGLSAPSSRGLPPSVHAPQYAPAAASAASHHHSPLGPAPLRAGPGTMRSATDPSHRPSPSLGLGPTPSMAVGHHAYNLSHPSHMWPPPPQPLQSPLAQQQTHPSSSLSQYSPHTHHAPPPTQHHTSSHPSSLAHPGSSMQYQGLAGMGGTTGYPSVTSSAPVSAGAGRNLYQLGPGTSPHYMHPSTTTSQPGLHGWATPQSNPPGPPGWGWGTSG